MLKVILMTTGHFLINQLIDKRDFPFNCGANYDETYRSNHEM